MQCYIVSADLVNKYYRYREWGIYRQQQHYTPLQEIADSVGSPQMYLLPNDCSIILFTLTQQIGILETQYFSWPCQ